MIRNLCRDIFRWCGYRAFRANRFDQEFVFYSRDGISPGPFLRHFVKMDEIKTCVDAGANTGQTARIFSGLFPAAAIYSFEPVRSTYAALLSETHSLERVVAVNLALGESEGEAMIALNINHQTNSLIHDQHHGSQSAFEQVRITTVDRFLMENKLERLNLLKTDTEGYDLKVLAGAQGALQENLIDLIYCEVGFDPNDRSHSYFSDVLDFLRPRGFHFAGLYNATFGDQYPGILFANALFVHRDSNVTMKWKDCPWHASERPAAN